MFQRNLHFVARLRVHTPTWDPLSRLFFFWLHPLSCTPLPSRSSSVAPLPPCFYVACLISFAEYMILVCVWGACTQDIIGALVQSNNNAMMSFGTVPIPGVCIGGCVCVHVLQPKHTHTHTLLRSLHIGSLHVGLLPNHCFAALY